MTITETNMLVDRAAGRKDGVYKYKSYLWVVKDEGFVAFSNYYGECFQRMGQFNVSMGKIDGYESDRRKHLLKWLKSQ